MVRIVAISDTHCKEEELIIPDGDMLIHAGDLTMMGEEEETIYGLEWLQEQTKRFKHVIYVEGNHDFCGWSNDTLFKELRNKHAKDVIVLRNESIEIEGYKIHGFPYIPILRSWAFFLRPRDMYEAAQKIPLDTDILISHSPPLGILDKIDSGENVGNKELRDRIDEFKNLKVSISGHIHESYGHIEEDNIDFYNVAVLDERYMLKNPATVINI